MSERSKEDNRFVYSDYRQVGASGRSPPTVEKKREKGKHVDGTKRAERLVSERKRNSRVKEEPGGRKKINS